ncbi:hypothetical protein [Neptuniibacter sp. QD37_11]|uniref:hypothetical protein n=1 Tax=Neptuniibacter sp. QD37_11 TaxID=3398209 RepID=UPI0039F601B8
MNKEYCSLIEVIKAEKPDLFEFPELDILYHVTERKRLSSIAKWGLSPNFYGQIHGTMEVSTPGKAVYLTTDPYQANLNTGLFERNGLSFGENDTGDIVVLKIDASILRGSQVALYPDDGLYCGFAQEDIFETPEDISEALGVPLGHAESLLEHWDAFLDTEMAEAFQWLTKWYLEEHGDIAFEGLIPPESIIGVTPYDREAYLNANLMMEQCGFDGLPDAPPEELGDNLSL